MRKMQQKKPRVRRANKGRARIRQSLGMHRLCVIRSSKHIGVQLIAHGHSGDSDRVLARASTQQKSIRESCASTANAAAAAVVGTSIAELAKQLGIERVAFDRSGYKYHGRVAALAKAARDNGLIF